MTQKNKKMAKNVKTAYTANVGEEFTVVLEAPIKQGDSSSFKMFVTKRISIMSKEAVDNNFNEFIFNHKYQASKNPKGLPGVGDPFFDEVEAIDFVNMKNEEQKKEIRKTIEALQAQEDTLKEVSLIYEGKSDLGYNDKGYPINLKVDATDFFKEEEE